MIPCHRSVGDPTLGTEPPRLEVALLAHSLRSIVEAEFMIPRKNQETGNGSSVPDITVPVFESDPLAQEYFESLHKRTHLEGEKALLLAVLEDAIDCFQKYRFAQSPRGRGLFCEAEHWIMEAKNGSVFSFDSVCELLELNPNHLRQGLRRWKENTDNKADKIGRASHHKLRKKAA
jgi:hypothetical protein